MSIVLYIHNETSFKSAMAMIDKVGKAAVIHPTGTGKSFIGFKLCEDNGSLTDSQIEKLKKIGVIG